MINGINLLEDRKIYFIGNLLILHFVGFIVFIMTKKHIIIYILQVTNFVTEECVDFGSPLWNMVLQQIVKSSL